MTVPVADQLVIEQWTGAYDEDDHSPLYDQYGDGHLVALHVLRTRLAAITLGPSQAAVDGDYSEDYKNTIKALQDLIANLENVAEALGLDINLGNRQTLTVGHVVLNQVRVRPNYLDGVRLP